MEGSSDMTCESFRFSPFFFSLSKWVRQIGFAIGFLKIIRYYIVSAKKYIWREMNSRIVVFRCWANFARLWARTKTSPKSTCSHIIFVVYFKFWIKNSGGEDFNQILMNIPSFWCIFVCVAELDHTYHQKKWWQYIARPLATHSFLISANFL